MTFISTQTVVQSGPSVPFTSAAAGSRETEELGSLTCPMPVLVRKARTLAVMAWCFTRSSGGGESLQLAAPWGTVALVAANLYVIFFGVSWGPVTWVLLGEMFPNRIRAIALAVAAAAQWLANFAITASFPGLAEIGLPFAYGLYALFALLSLWFVVARVRETRGVELEAMSD